MKHITFINGRDIPMELHRPVIVQKINLNPIEDRKKAIEQAGFNTFLLNTENIFLDMLTDSGTNAMSNNQLAAMMQADEAYAGSSSFKRLEKSVCHFFNKKLFLPVHQGRAAEHILAQTFVKKGDVVPMNFHFTTTRAHIEFVGGSVEELIVDEVFKTKSKEPFKGNMDIQKLTKFIERVGKEKIPFIRIEVTTNLTGGQPVSLENIRKVRKVAQKWHIPVVIDACLIAENAWFIKTREKGCEDMSIQEIIHAISECGDIIYFSGRKLGAARGGGIITNTNELFMKMRAFVPLFEGFLTYGGMSTKEIEALAVGLNEFTDETVISQMPKFIQHVVSELEKKHVPVVTPAGALGIHIDARKFLPHIDQKQYPAGALAAAFFLISGIRGMERGTISTDRNAVTKQEMPAELELIRLAVPRRVFSLSHMEFLIDRLVWLFKNRDLIKGLTFTEEPSVLRFFFGRLKPVSDWPEKLVTQFKKDFGPMSL